MKHLKFEMMIAGGMLLVSSACVNAARSLSAADAQAVMTPLKIVSLQDGLASGNVVFSVRIPTDKSWQRVRGAWGDPGYLLSVTSPGGKTLLCFDKYDLAVRVSGAAGPIQSGRATSPLYGYSLDCSSVGIKFNASPGDLVEVRVGYPVSASKIPGNLMLCAYWGPETKDRLVGLATRQDLRSLF